MIPTAHTLRARNRSVDRKLAQAENVLNAMRAGASLHLTYSRSGRNGCCQPAAPFPIPPLERLLPLRR
jgi:hypothetical protein